MRVEHDWIEISAVRPRNRSQVRIDTHLFEKSAFLQGREYTAELDQLSHVNNPGRAILKAQKQSVLPIQFYV